jgi:hypothetical protein
MSQSKSPMNYSRTPSPDLADLVKSRKSDSAKGAGEARGNGSKKEAGGAPDERGGGSDKKAALLSATADSSKESGKDSKGSGAKAKRAEAARAFVAHLKPAVVVPGQEAAAKAQEAVAKVQEAVPQKKEVPKVRVPIRPAALQEEEEEEMKLSDKPQAKTTLEEEKRRKRAEKFGTAGGADAGKTEGNGTLKGGVKSPRGAKSPRGERSAQTQAAAGNAQLGQLPKSPRRSPNLSAAAAPRETEPTTSREVANPDFAPQLAAAAAPADGGAGKEGAAATANSSNKGEDPHTRKKLKLRIGQRDDLEQSAK